jgi:hypothetical protein
VVAQGPGGAESFANERFDGGSRGRLQDRFISLRLHACKQGSLGLGLFLVRLLRLVFGLRLEVLRD